MKKKYKEKHADEEMSYYIRVRDNWTCVICNKSYERSANKLDCSHYFDRNKRAVRFDPENCDTLCKACHRVYEYEKNGLYYDFKEKQLGKERHQALRERAKQEYTGRRPEDFKELVMHFRQEAKRITEERNGFIFGKH